MSKSRRSNENTKWIVAFFIELIVIALMSYGVFRVYIHEKYQKLDHVNDLTEDELGLNSGVNPEMDEYTNIALFGIDARDNSLGKGNRSDAILVASINNDTKEIRLLSVYRDTLLEITKEDGTTVTTADLSLQFRLLIRTWI